MTVVRRTKKDKDDILNRVWAEVREDIRRRRFTGRYVLEIDCRSGGISQIWPTAKGEGLLK